ncbi:putative disease resistance protein At3g14460 [Vitis riparia]|uniref:putative disease resistance protein At3g14460 n=1 Tax=Vitis riparia TaxID=96939 RepID=UPI00155B1FBB|nr:putative disease resistance protein At3g14460 [Vitis riparia]XP_034705302.1 putative disease resistance protein At3g14460 [Vitis riparia]XP_034705303.1 putative disease resistance protein At3g14460 [Vitis riparia]XP_034705304.1 putative disease resistance protein At3g14460 [Vitis riparia]XP_034705305.1 putative disease resistance protein At3g14460 [Vitis riparia]XP_034705306.1 putative disease resistance protein At3g14460 [Vitis riparia]XP_034705307.1 putative disease resistance protein At
MLRKLVVDECESLKWLPRNYNSCALESLEIYMCPSLVCFPNSELPTTLKNIYIQGCENLTSLPEGMMHHNSTCCLENLIIDYCPSLKSFPTGELPSTLKNLAISVCSNLESTSENMCPNNSALDSLYLVRYPNLRTLPECLHNLKNLQIIDCEGLECFPKGGLSVPNLTRLCIAQCRNLKSLPHQMTNLKSLQLLRISGCPRVESFPEEGLAPNLTSLKIDDYEECLLPISLTSITINGMESLASLALRNLISLQVLEISNCPNFCSLASLPATLERLQIQNSPILKARCSKEKGEYWPNIAHIPSIWIVGE